MYPSNTASPRSEMTNAALKQRRNEGRVIPLLDPENSELGAVDVVIDRPFFRRKYLFDRVAGIGLLVALSPLLLSLYAVVRCTSKGPGFYRQRRVGLNGKTFEILKLRTMVVNAEKPGQAIWCVKNDSRITSVGRILRRMHLDELPQLWNVALGDMSLVGPRPERPEICKELAKRIDCYYDRVAIKPGVTGLSQINLPPDESLDDVRRKQILDLQYIQEANTWLELRIIGATAMRMLGVRGQIVMKAMQLCRRDLLRDTLSPKNMVHQDRTSNPRPVDVTEFAAIRTGRPR